MAEQWTTDGSGSDNNGNGVAVTHVVPLRPTTAKFRDNTPTTMRTLYFGGSFNPVHCGHLICGRAVAEQAGFDRIALVPNQQSPHKPEVAGDTPAIDRVTMCRLAVARDAFFTVEDWEASRPPPSYTITTVRAMSRRNGTHVHWLIGADQVPALPHWHEAGALLAEANLLIMARPGWPFDWTTLPTPFQRLRETVVSAPLVQISSTDIRRRVRAGQSIRYLVPDAVIDHIHRRGLYRSGQ